MADISMRFHKDMLVCTGSVAATLERQGADVENDLEMITMVEPETIHDVYRVEMSTEAQCLVAETSHLLPAKLLHKRMEKRLPELVQASMELAYTLKAQHVLVELGPTGLPLDSSSKASLVEVRDQYVRSAREFEKFPFDAYLLSGFTGVATLQCALMGLRMVSDKPIFACVTVQADGMLANGRDSLERAVEMMGEYGASVVGIQTGAEPAVAASLVKRVAACSDLPLMVQIDVKERNKRQSYPTPENPYFAAETMFDAIPHLRSAGVQFLRAVGQASPAYTGALSAMARGLDVIDVRGLLED